MDPGQAHGARRHDGPLTFLPGNIPISEHIDSLLNSGGEFVACHADLDDFQPCNDHCGYWRGDEMIRRVARTLVSNCDPRRDVAGHVGGDDFVVRFQSGDWLDRCERIVEAFTQKALSLFDAQAPARGQALQDATGHRSRLTNPVHPRSGEPLQHPKGQGGPPGWRQRPAGA